MALGVAQILSRFSTDQVSPQATRSELALWARGLLREQGLPEDGAHVRAVARALGETWEPVTVVSKRVRTKRVDEASTYRAAARTGHRIAVRPSGKSILVGVGIMALSLIWLGADVLIRHGWALAQWVWFGLPFGLIGAMRALRGLRPPTMEVDGRGLTARGRLFEPGTVRCIRVLPAKDMRVVAIMAGTSWLRRWFLRPSSGSGFVVAADLGDDELALLTDYADRDTAYAAAAALEQALDLGQELSPGALAVRVEEPGLDPSLAEAEAAGMAAGVEVEVPAEADAKGRARTGH